MNLLKDIKIEYKQPIKEYTFTKVGGKVDMLAFPKNSTEIQQLIKYCAKEEMPWMVLGNASNVILSDVGYRGMVIMLTNLATIRIDDDSIIADAGATLFDVTVKASDASLTGMEFACGIPGSVGGAVYMNAGAYGGEISEIVTSVEYMTREGEIITFQKEELQYQYRHTKLQEMDGIVIRATFSLQKGNKQQIQDKMDELMRLRRSKQPLEYPSCGSVFKRPQGYYTGKLIQDAGLQGKQIGGAQVSMKHAGFIINVGTASASDYIALIQHIQEVIKEKYEVELELEVKILGEL